MSFLQILDDERGSVLAFVAVTLVVLLGAVGLAMDASRGFLRKSELSRAADAGALAAAKALRRGQDEAEAHGKAVIKANGLDPSIFQFGFATEPDGERTVTVTVTDPLGTTFTRVLGFDQMDIHTEAVAGAPPIDLVLVLDQSGSMGRERCGNRGGDTAWDCLQDAAEGFVGHFDENMDRMGLVTFQLRATERVPMGQPFISDVRREIRAARSDGDTNSGEALRAAYDQLHDASPRDGASKAVVFFTDGRPTAFRGTILGQDRMIAVFVNGNQVRGYFNDPDNLPSDRAANPNGCPGWSSCDGWTEADVRAESRAKGTAWAESIRASGAVIYSIGLGDLSLLDSPSAHQRLLAPDTTWLRQIANVNGSTNPGQPQGKAFFIESGEDLEAVFDAVADDLLVRLAR